jgi:hypothetical protein
LAASTVFMVLRLRNTQPERQKRGASLLSPSLPRICQEYALQFKNTDRTPYSDHAAIITVRPADEVIDVTRCCRVDGLPETSDGLEVFLHSLTKLIQRFRSFPTRSRHIFGTGNLNSVALLRVHWEALGSPEEGAEGFLFNCCGFSVPS